MALQPMDVLDVVELFFGEELGPSTVRLSRTLPEEQASALAERIDACRLKTIAWLRDGVAGARPSDLLHLHDDLMSRRFADGSAALLPTLKQMVLYFERVVVAEPLFEWASGRMICEGRASEFERSQRLSAMLVADDEFLVDKDVVESRFYDVDFDYASAGQVCELPVLLRNLAAIAPLVRIGAIALVPTDSSLRGIPVAPDESMIDDIWLEAWRWLTDPVLAWVLVRRVQALAPWELACARFHGDSELVEAAAYTVTQLIMPAEDSDTVLGPLWQAVIAKHPVAGASRREIDRAARVSAAQRAFGLCPVPSDDFDLQHLSLAGAALDGFGGLPLPPPTALAVRYQVPPLHDTSINDLVALRSAEDVFAEFRGALNALADVVGQDGASAADHAVRVAEASQDVLGPVHHRLARQLAASRVRGALARATAGKAASMVVTAASQVFPPLAAGRGIAASAAGAVAGRRSRAERRGLEVSTRLLTGLIND